MRKLLEQADNLYRAEVDVDVYVDGSNIDLDEEEPTTFVEYRIGLEFRSWGLKTISLYDFQPVDIDYKLEGGEWQTSTVDLEEADREWQDGGAYRPERLSVTIDKDGNVKDATLVLNYIKEEL